MDATVNFDPTAKINVYPDETANESILQTASFVEEHLKSLCKYTQLFSVYNKQRLFFKETLVKFQEFLRKE